MGSAAADASVAAWLFRHVPLEDRAGLEVGSGPVYWRFAQFRAWNPGGNQVFCPNCGTENAEPATTCKKCGFNLKSAAAPKFKGTMLMMNTPGAPRAGTPGAPPAGPPGPPERGASTPPPPPGGGIPRPQLKGTMLGVAPPSIGSAQPGMAPPPGAPPTAPGHSGPSGMRPAPGGPQVNPLGGTLVANPAGGFGPPPGGPAPYGGPPPGAPSGFGATAPGQPPGYSPPGGPPPGAAP